MATAVAAMLWSRMTILKGAANLVVTNAAPLWIDNMGNETNLTFGDVGIIYPVNDTVEYIRPTLNKSGWLYFILAINPILMLVMMGLTALFYSALLSNGFEITSILSGVNRPSLDILSGAALSGDLARSIKLVINTYQNGDTGTIEYKLELPSDVRTDNGKLVRNVRYY